MGYFNDVVLILLMKIPIAIVLGLTILTVYGVDIEMYRTHIHNPNPEEYVK